LCVIQKRANAQSKECYRTHCFFANALFKHIAILVPAVAKSFHANADRRLKKKYDRTTMAIRNAGESAHMKVITLNKLTAKRKVKCLENPHYA
jgi:hypothetical protein